MTLRALDLVPPERSLGEGQSEGQGTEDRLIPVSLYPLCPQPGL